MSQFATNTTLPRYLRDEQDKVEKIARGHGLDFFPVVFEMLSYDHMNEIAAYGGFPNRYPHWRFGMEYERLSKSYEYGLSKIYEMVINNNPSYAYLLEGNSLTDQKLVMCHVFGHVDFFKNNFAFRATDLDAGEHIADPVGRRRDGYDPNRRWVDKMANHGSAVRRIVERYGIQKVEEFVDICLSLENLIDPWSRFVVRRRDSRPDEEPEQVEVPRLRSKDYMEEFINPSEYMEEQKRKIEAERELEKGKFPAQREQDVLMFLLENAPLERWERAILSIIRDEGYYFVPQMQTKIMNEGWASYWHSKMMTGDVCDWSEIVDYAENNAGVMATSGGRLNPYKLGVELYRNIEERWDKGLTLVGGRRSGAVLALAGPPGVGKTSLGESVARAMGRKFARVALGGVRDEAEIRGHRRTYVGALPGRIVRAIREAGSMNPVILLDEVDKLGTDYRGDPTAALLEVLDPAQNHTFRDHYLEVELDLSDVLFIATANVPEAIPDPLLDRMELVALDGYTEDEKVTIARDHLLPRQLERAGLDAADVTLDGGALRRMAAEYTREAGVRGLERSIARVLRKIAAQLAGGTATLPVTVGPADLYGYLGHPRHTPESAERTAVPGVATGLAVTGAGGDVLFIEASLADPETGNTAVTLTGQLGDVMKESAQIALSYLRSHGAELELPVGDLKDRGVHVHVPAGAVPKDGPSAGVTMTTALASLLSGRLVRSDVAMTGEVSLTGRVLPIGGVKQKLLAAHRAGITTVLIPKRNEPDLEDVPENVRAEVEVHPVSDVREVLELALEPANAPAAVAA